MLSYSIPSGALESHDILLSYPTITTISLHNSIILIIAHLSGLINHTLNPKSTDQHRYIPYYQPFQIPAKQSAPIIEPTWLFQACGFKVITGTILGSVVGIAMGMFLGAMSGDAQVMQVCLSLSLEEFM